MSHWQQQSYSGAHLPTQVRQFETEQIPVVCDIKYSFFVVPSTEKRFLERRTPNVEAFFELLHS